jgi:hypothetical protein
LNPPVEHDPLDPLDPDPRSGFWRSCHSGRALFFGYDVPAVPEGKVYQFWLIQGGKSLPGRFFVPVPNGSAQWIDAGPASGREATAAAPGGPTILKSAARG